MTRTGLCLLLLPLLHPCDDAELWLVELEHNDGVRLQFQGAELELGSAELHGVAQPDGLVPGMHLAIQSRYGVAETIRVLDGAPDPGARGQLAAGGGSTAHPQSAGIAAAGSRRAGV